MTFFKRKQIYIVPQLEEITLEKVQAIHKLSDGQTRRKCFQNSGVQKKKSNPSFSVGFQESIRGIFEAMMGISLRYSSQFKNYWCPVTNEEIAKIEEWERGQGTRVFIRDNLSCSIALAEYSTDTGESHRTQIGEMVYQIKYQGNKELIPALVGRCVETIRSLPYYRKADAICAVPASPGKEWDLPTEIATLVAKELGLEDLTDNFRYVASKPSLKGLELSKKWPALESANIQYSGNLSGRKVILIDDLYQSGVTMQFVAMKLQKVGAYHVYGLSLVKNLSDTDNQ